ncbi:MAG: viologen exporter family transport system permease protein [Chthoniobacter sp.]|jgi:ABC-2 type transport system permease protein|nr:viologen exporter family transport system permease protein [Chthoniobacter sp.]
MRRYLEIYWLMVRNSLIREMNFKANFILWMVVELLWFAGQIVFLEVLFMHTDRIGDWSKWECVLLAGTHQITSQLFQAFFYVNLAELPDLVRTGRLDLFLVLPVDAQFAVSTRRFGFNSIINALVGVAIVVFSLFQLRVTPHLHQIGLYGVAIGFGVAVHYAVLFFLATVAFWIVRAQGLIYGYYNVFNIARYPDVVFRGAFRIIFSYLIPVILVANVPTRTLARAFEAPWVGLAQLAGATLFILLASRAFWQFALRRYSSASS